MYQVIGPEVIRLLVGGFMLVELGASVCLMFAIPVRAMNFTFREGPCFCLLIFGIHSLNIFRP